MTINKRMEGEEFQKESLQLASMEVSVGGPM